MESTRSKNPVVKKFRLTSQTRKNIRKNYDLYLIFLPVLAYFLIFKYYPIYGVQIAFKDYNPVKGFSGSEWVGFKHFIRFFNSYDFWRLMKNTLGIGFYLLLLNTPMPILLALMLNEVRNKPFKKFTQTVTYAPYFISMMVMCGMVIMFLSPRSGLINMIIMKLGGEAYHYMADPKWFKTIFVFSTVWQQTGWASIIYIAALSTVDPQLYEAATIDGCSKLRKIWHIDIPAILPTAIILLIMSVGRIMNVNFQRLLPLQNPLNLSSSDVIQSYVYRMGLVNAQFSFSAAAGLFNNVINLILLLTVNKISKTVSKTSFW